MVATRRVRVLCLAVLSVLSALPTARAGQADTRQQVLISFDGAGPVAQWERARALARRTGAHFTFFLSCAFLLTPQTRDAYRGPEGTRSNIGWAASRDDIAARLRQIWAARREGHEIAGHGCGHLDGTDWTGADWRLELSAFRDVLDRAWSINAIPHEPAAWREFVRDEVIGFRAPYLARGKGLDGALAASGLRYDASLVSRGPVAPEASGGLTRFALPTIPEGPDGRRILAMDYNLFVRHSGGFERGDEDGALEQRTVRAFTAALDAELAGKRRPLQIGLHFTLMNGGAYWRALERFAADACARDDVVCATYTEAVAGMARPPS
ncbi:MAG: polysaccharide deacetylase [Rhizobiaceae bacterium]